MAGPVFWIARRPRDEAMKEYVTQIISAQAEPEDRRHALDHKGAVDVAYILPGVARFRTNIFHSREKFAMVMRRIVDQDSEFRRSEPSPHGGRDGRSSSRNRHRFRHDRVGQIDDAGGDHRQDQPHPLRTNHHR